MGYGPEDYAGKPVIGIINTWSRHQPVPRALQGAGRGRQARRLAGRRLSAGVAGDVAVSEPFVKPTTMLYRNFLAMETEELLR